jgi:hypothetical protein
MRRSGQIAWARGDDSGRGKVEEWHKWYRRDVVSLWTDWRRSGVERVFSVQCRCCAAEWKRMQAHMAFDSCGEEVWSAALHNSRKCWRQSDGLGRVDLLVAQHSCALDMADGTRGRQQAGGQVKAHFRVCSKVHVRYYCMWTTPQRRRGALVMVVFPVRYSLLVVPRAQHMTTSLDPSITHQPRNAIFLLLHGAGTSSLILALHQCACGERVQPCRMRSVFPRPLCDNISTSSSCLSCLPILDATVPRRLISPVS